MTSWTFPLAVVVLLVLVYGPPDVATVLGLALVLAAAAIMWRWRSTRTARMVARAGGMRARVDTHGRTGPASSVQRFIGRHEVGHVVGAEATGMGVASVEIGDGWGYVTPRRFVSVQASITFLAAGHLSVGSRSGASADLANIRRLAAMLPAETRKADLHAAIADARREVSRHSGRIRRDGHRLADTGRW